MPTQKILKLAGLNIGIVLLNIALFSPGLFNIKMTGSSAFGIALGSTAILMSLIAFIYGNYKLITEKGKVLKISEIKNAEECINSLKQAYGKNTFDHDISTVLQQIEDLQRKKETIRNNLLQKFNIIEKSYERFNETLVDVEYVFFTNVKSILNKINAFDEEDYKRVKNDALQKKFSTEIINTRLSIYNEYISFVKKAIEDNEQILLRLDRLLLEISKFNSLEDGEIENMSEIKGIDELIKKSKYYK